MVNISKRKLKPHLEKHILQELSRQIARTRGVSHARNFLFELLTPAEYVQLAKRLALIIMLFRGYSFDQIERSLKVSPTTVASHWRGMKTGKYQALRSVALFHARGLPEDSILESLLKLVAEGPNARKSRWDFLK